MKYLLLLSLFGLVACNAKRETKKIFIQGPVTTNEVKVEEPQVKKISGETCDLYDEEEHERYRIFLVESGRTRFYRLNDHENLASPGVRTVNIDFYDMFKISESDNFMQVGVSERLNFNDRGVWKSYSELIKAEKGTYGDKYILKRTRFLRTNDRHSQNDWVRSHPEDFRISNCFKAEIQVTQEWLPKRKSW